MQPVKLDHFLDKDALAHDGAAQVEREGGEVFPVAAHHLAGGDLGVAPDELESHAAGGAVDPADCFVAADGLFDEVSHVGH